jgi:hypothetical protein
MNICLPLPYFQSEGLEDSYRQYHESSADESDADGFFVTFVHTADKSTKYFRQKNKRNKKYPRFISIRHKLLQNIPDIWRFPSYALPLPSEMFNLTALRNEYEHETKNSYRRSSCCSQPVEARYVVGYPPLELV